MWVHVYVCVGVCVCVHVCVCMCARYIHIVGRVLIILTPYKAHNFDKHFIDQNGIISFVTWKDIQQLERVCDTDCWQRDAVRF